MKSLKKRIQELKNISQESDLPIILIDSWEDAFGSVPLNKNEPNLPWLAAASLPRPTVLVTFNKEASA